MKERSIAMMKIAKIGYIVMSVVFIAVGIVFIAYPGLSAVIMSRALGIAMIIFGIIKLIGYFSKDLFRLAFQYDLQFGILIIVLGLIVVIRPSEIINLIFIAIGIATLADALFKMQIAIDSREFGITSWWGIMFLAVLDGIIGIALVFCPSVSARLLTILLGISLLTEGILNLWVAVTTVKIIKHQRPDTIEIDYFETDGEIK